MTNGAYKPRVVFLSGKERANKAKLSRAHEGPPPGRPSPRRPSESRTKSLMFSWIFVSRLSPPTPPAPGPEGGGAGWASAARGPLLGSEGVLRPPGRAKFGVAHTSATVRFSFSFLWRTERGSPVNSCLPANLEALLLLHRNAAK